MKKIRHIAALLALIVVGVSTTYAQQDITKSIEVTKAYVPTVNGATKLIVRPRMDDTVRLQPEIDYSIKPVACYTTFSSRPISPAQVNATPYRTNNPGYVAIAFGFQPRTQFDLYLNNRENSERVLGGYINHRGSYSRRQSDLDTLQNAISLYNAVGFFGSQRWGKMTLRGDVGYDNRVLHRFGSFTNPAFWTGSPATEDTIALLPTAKESLVDYGRAHGNIYFGHDFANLSTLNFGAGMDAGFTHDIRGTQMADINIDGRVAKMFGMHGFDAAVEYNSYYGIARLSERGAQSFVLRPRYLMRYEDVRLGVGVDYGYRTSRGFESVGKSYVFPHVDFSIDPLSGYLIPYIKATGDFIDGSFESLSRANPYIAAGVTAPTGAKIETEAGFTGNALQSITYGLYFNYTHFDNMYHFVSLYKPMGSQFADSFGGIIDNAERYTVGASAEYIYAGVLSTALSAHYYCYQTKHLARKSNGGGTPSYDVALDVKYRHKKKFTIEASAKLIGARKFYEMAGATSTTMMAEDVAGSVVLNRVPACVDVNVTLNLHINKGWWLFVNGTNLAGSKLYTFNHYRSLGAGVMIGFKSAF